MTSFLERNQDATVYVGGLDEKVNESILWELFVQAGPVMNIHMPKDRVSQCHQGYGFVEFMTEQDADYAIKIMNMIKLYAKPIKVNKASTQQKNLEVGANLFVGNLDADVDEKLLYDTFSAFGAILQTPKIMRDTDTGGSKGYAFINYASFSSSDAAIMAMNGQYLCNRPLMISYAYKKNTKGIRHGSDAERLMAFNNPVAAAQQPNMLFSDKPPQFNQFTQSIVNPPMMPPPPPMPMQPHMMPPHLAGNGPPMPPPRMMHPPIPPMFNTGMRSDMPMNAGMLPPPPPLNIQMLPPGIAPNMLNPPPPLQTPNMPPPANKPIM
ncbi:ribonucleoprotein, chloroplastic [Intoshia linei]|uniref:Splicing factor 3B subunit 4 n=1 Tax=Intoshia linei TaxID=1819745 RepID=A0A177BCD0_9BILA|nr:ribonucleoprotein, chloroplastic [Intoshia linei]